MESALYDVQGVSMSPSIGEDGYLIEGEALGLAVLRLKDGIELRNMESSVSFKQIYLRLASHQN